MKNKILYFLFFLLPILTLSAQESGLKGTVLSGEDNLPLPGATVLVSGTNTSTITDFDGNFSFSSVASDASIIVSYIGFENQTVAINGEKSLSITLKSMIIN